MWSKSARILGLLCLTDSNGKGRAGRAKILAEEAEGDVVAAGALVGRQRHLVRPLPIHRAFAEFAFAIDHGVLHAWFGRRPRSPLLAGV